MAQNNLFKRLLTNPKVRYGGYAGIITLAAVVAIVVLNLLVQQLGWQLDLTDRGVYTLSEQTQQIIDEVDDDVTIYLLSSRSNGFDRIREALERYAATSARISLELIDPETNPGFVQQYDPEGEGLRDGSVVVTSGDKYRSIAYIDLLSLDTRNPQNPQVLGLNVERRITNALIFVATGRTPVVYQTQGRNEVSVFSASQTGRLADELANANFEVRDLNLIQAPQIPEDAAVLLMLGPRSDISEGEAEKIRDFLSGGGTAFFAVDMESGPMPVLAELLAAYGIGIPYGVVGEPDGGFNVGNLWQIAPRLLDHPVAAPLVENRLRTVLPFARPVETLESKPRSVTIEPIMSTTDSSFFRADLTVAEAGMIATDRPGPFDLAVSAIETEFANSEEITRLIVVGDAGFLTPFDAYNQIPANLDFFLNSLNWLQDQEEVISVRPKSTFQLPMQLTGRQQLIFAGLFTIVIPLGILIAGLVIWLRRRHR